MSTDEKTATSNAEETAAATTTSSTTTTTSATSENLSSEAVVEQERSEKILKAKELYSHGSRNFLVKSYAEAADELSQVCALYGELHGELSDELGMPYLLYAKSLIALALDENKVIDVPDEEEEEDDDEEDEEAGEAASTNGDKAETNGKKLETIKEDDSTAVAEAKEKKPATKSDEKANSKTEVKADSKSEKKSDPKAEEKPDSKSVEKTDSKSEEKPDSKSEKKIDSKSEEKPDSKTEEKPDSKSEVKPDSKSEKKPDSKSEVKPDSKSEKKPDSKSEEVTPMETDKPVEESDVSSIDEKKVKPEDDDNKPTNGEATNGSSSVVKDDEKPSTSNGEAGEDAVDDDEENEAASNLQLAWEILELAAKIFTRQGDAGRSNLAEVHTELGNIEFENNVVDSARDDYQKALVIYMELPANYRRAMAEIHYKIGLSYLMQQSNKEGATALKEACKLIAGEIDEMKVKPELSDKDKNNIQDMEETKQEIEAKIIEIEETQAQNIAEVRAALDSYIKPMSSGDVDAGSSKSAAAPAASSASSAPSAAITSSSKPTDISHLIKRKKPEDASSEAEAAVACSPAKRPAV